MTMKLRGAAACGRDACASDADQGAGLEQFGVRAHDLRNERGHLLVVESLQADTNDRGAGGVCQRDLLMESVVVCHDDVAVIRAPSQDLVVRRPGHPGGRRVHDDESARGQKRLGSQRQGLIEKKGNQAPTSSSVRSSTAAAA
jgi:hypothetical protein